MNVILRESVHDDLETFFAHQAEPEGVRRADFPARDREAFFTHWETKIFAVPENIAYTVVADGRIAGNIVSWPQDGRRMTGYWLGEEFWGRGLGTTAMRLFLELETTRPLYGDVAEGNTASIRLLERCGFTRQGEPEDGYVLLMLE
ncbi:GNAT family N-acetyltransferase [Actinorhabdospora filicis]|nr:GNAT family N-acetyltransferase [Actinorhabdospora filicis]